MERQHLNAANHAGARCHVSACYCMRSAQSGLSANLVRSRLLTFSSRNSERHSHPSLGPIAPIAISMCQTSIPQDLDVPHTRAPDASATGATARFACLLVRGHGHRTFGDETEAKSCDLEQTSLECHCVCPTYRCEVQLPLLLRIGLQAFRKPAWLHATPLRPFSRSAWLLTCAGSCGVPVYC